MKTSFVILTLVSMLVCVEQLFPAQSSVRQLKIKRLVRELEGKKVSVCSGDSLLTEGEMQGSDGFRLFILTQNGTDTVAVARATHLIVRAGFSDVLLAGVAAVLAGGFGSGLAVLLAADISGTALTMTAIVSSVFGGWVGWSAVRGENRIELE